MLAQRLFRYPGMIHQPKDVEMSMQMRQRIAESVTVSRRTIPSFALDRFVETGAIDIARQSIGREVEQRTGLKLTLTDFLLQAMGDTLATMPQILDRWVEIDGRPVRIVWVVCAPPE